jgi:hypothetical protein
MILHTCPHQPWGDEFLPGKAMGRWGTHFGRNQTWAKSGKGFFEYLNCCQALLQWGEPSKYNLGIESCSSSDVRIESIAREQNGEYIVFVVNRSKNAASFKMVINESSLSTEWYDPVNGAISSLKIVDGKISLSLAPNGSGFLIMSEKKNSRENFEKGDYKQGLISLNANSLIELKDGWELTFGSKTMKLNNLIDWTMSDNNELKYFSGTATYSIKFDAPNASLARVLNLGNCNGQIAKVILNGRELTTLWCEPYEVMLPKDILKETSNELRIEFTNVWANRLIGDEQEAQDCEFVTAPIPGGTYLKSYPEWFKYGLKSRPSKARQCFTDWNYFTKDSKLVPSGLLGPVKLSGFGSAEF